MSIAKALQTRVVAGKNAVFMAIVCLGYLSGTIHKAVYSFNWIIALYGITLVTVTLDLVLYFVYSWPRALWGVPVGGV